MKIIISSSAIKYPLTGVGRYTYEIAKNILKSQEIDELLFYKDHRVFNKFPNKPNKLNRNIAKIRHSIMKRKLFSWSYDFFSKNLNHYEGYIFHGTDFSLPYDYHAPTIVNIHDISVFTHPHHHPPERFEKAKKTFAHTLETANRVIVMAEFGRQELIRHFGYPSEKITVTLLAGSDMFYPRSTKATKNCIQAYQITPNQYTLYVGTIEPRKNVSALIDAYAMLPISLRKNYPLVIVGHRGWESEAIHQKITKAVSEGWARYLGFVSDDDLPLLFSAARLFAYPSLYEGFGLPVLEALASGVPVVCSNSSSLPEVAGDAALMHDPEDVSQLSNYLQQGLLDEAWRDSAIQKGLIQAKRFSWEKCARETINAYRLINS